MKTEEKEFIEKLKSPKHRERAYMELLDQYQRRIYWFVRKIVEDHEMANDAMQNTFVRVYKSLDTFKGDSSLLTWIYTIARNEALRCLEKKNRDFIETYEDFDQRLNYQIANDAYFNPDEVQKHLHRAISEMSDKQQEVFKMHYYDDLKFREISEITGYSEGTIKSLFYASKKKVEKIIAIYQTFIDQ